MKNIFLKGLVFVFVFLVCVNDMSADVLDIPRNAGDKVQIHLYPQHYAHPVDYWWYKDPSASGSWDYFTPVKRYDEPVRLPGPGFVAPVGRGKRG